MLTKEQRELYQNPEVITKILNTCRTIAIVGLSTSDQKASYFVGSYLKAAGYNVIPVHPKADSILGLKAYPKLAAIPESVDLVDIFRPAHEVDEIVEAAIEIGAKAVWQQLKIANVEAAERARQAGLWSVVDRCVKIEHGRYSGGLHEVGMNTEIISAQRVHRWV
jgi:hypothetical protein